MAGNEIRRSQAVVPFGVGSIVEFRYEALMPAGLDAWPVHTPERIRDQRLAARLGVDHFRVPPPKPDRNASSGTTDPLPHIRFPRWHFCSRCRWLKQADLFDQRRPACDNMETSPRLKHKPPCGESEEKKRRRMKPLRFIAVCPAGHIEDFPWNAWVHTEKGESIDRNRGCKPERLYFYATQNGGLSGLMVKCTGCDRKRSLMGATSNGGLKGLTCIGAQPWLGEHQGPCAGPDGFGPPELVALQRGASNLYFPVVESSILIPPHSARVHQVLEEPKVRKLLEGSDVPVPEETLRAIATLRGVEIAQLRDALEGQKLEGGEQDETVHRFAEYQALRRERREPGDLLIVRPQRIEDYSSPVRDYFDHVSLVERLAETRTLTGFTRLSPGGNPSPLSVGPLDWLPAFRVHGEGLFLGLEPDRLYRFCSRFIDTRLQAVFSRTVAWGTRLLVTVELLLLHTLAHALIKRLSFEAGYGTSSIRERIYSAPSGHPQRMSGILLYTAAGDADGTLGGLVGLGRAGALERTLVAALEEVRWCASDPVCVESTGQGPGSLNIAACHACTLLPETSCELQNRLLDRRPVIEFFSDSSG